MLEFDFGKAVRTLINHGARVAKIIDKSLCRKVNYFIILLSHLSSKNAKDELIPVFSDLYYCLLNTFWVTIVGLITYRLNN